jgi:hypothetical protein
MPIISPGAISPLKKPKGGVNWSTFWATRTPSALILTVLSDTEIKLDWTNGADEDYDGLRIYSSTDGTTFTAAGTVAANVETYTATGLTEDTTYYFYVVAYHGSLESPVSNTDNGLTYYAINLTSSSSNVIIWKMGTLVNQTVTLTGTARFYSDIDGTLNESTTWSLATGGLKTAYLKCPSGTAKMILQVRNINQWGNSANWGVFGSISVNCNITKFINLVTFMMHSSVNIGTTALPSKLTYFALRGGATTWSYNGALPNTLTGVRLEDSVGHNWTGLDIGSGSNYSEIILTNYRIAKMSSADMVTLLTQMTNRTGTMPATIIINDYADYASPPVAVTNAVNTLKATKGITTVILGA